MAAYRDTLELAANWLGSIQNPDGGWGLAPGQASSLVNTAEALFVLHNAGSHLPAVQRGLEFLESKCFVHLDERGHRIRYVALPLAVIAECFPVHSKSVERLARWLWAAQNDDGGWGIEAKNQESDLLSTYLAVSALAKAGHSTEEFDQTGRWVVSRATETGWTLQANQTFSYVAISYALLILAETGFKTHPSISKGLDTLKEIQVWTNEDQTISGTIWRHATYSLVLQALSRYVDDLYAKPIAEGIRHANRLISNKGWVEQQGTDTLSIRAQYWAAVAFETLSKKLDPAKYIIRIEAERTQSILKEPEFLPFAVNTRWHTVLPARAYRIAVITILMIGLATGLGVFQLVPPLNVKSMRLVGVVMIFAAWYGVRIRRKQFPRLFKWGDYLLAALAFLVLLWDLLGFVLG